MGMIWIFTIFFAIGANAHFGWNWTAQSDAEVMADAAFLILAALAIIAGKLE